MTYLPILITLGVILVLALLFLSKVLREEPKEVEKICKTTGGTCCGGGHCHDHEKKKEPRPVYFDDEELDELKGKSPEEYTEEEKKLFEEVFDTLRLQEREEWFDSLEHRGITPPTHLHP